MNTSPHASLPPLTHYKQFNKRPCHGPSKTRLDDPKYSDLQIVCQGVTFHVHRNVVCPQLKVIERECDGEWLGAGTRRIVNEVFGPLVIDRMLQYMYRGDYELRERFVGAARVEEMRVDGDAEGKVKEHPLIEHVRVYAVADCE